MDGAGWFRTEIVPFLGGARWWKIEGASQPTKATLFCGVHVSLRRLGCRPHDAGYTPTAGGDDVQAGGAQEAGGSAGAPATSPAHPSRHDFPVIQTHLCPSALSGAGASGEGRGPEPGQGSREMSRQGARQLPLVS